MISYDGLKPEQSIWISKGGERYFGPGVERLLDGVKRTGSLSAAAREMNMSYTKAWRITKRSEKLSGCKLLESKAGGARGGGAQLTNEGEQLLSDYVAFREEAAGEVRRVFGKYFCDTQDNK